MRRRQYKDIRQANLGRDQPRPNRRIEWLHGGHGDLSFFGEATSCAPQAVGNGIMRIVWVDNAKAIGMVLVVWVHTSGINELSTTLIHSFVMPLFFFLAGCLAKQRHFALPLGSFLKRNLTLLIVPYLSFWCISYGYWLARRFVLHEAVDSQSWLDPLAGLLYGTGDMLYVNVVLWFFVCLFSATFLFWCLLRLRSTTTVIIAVVAFGCLGPFVPAIVGLSLPWCLDVAMVAVTFFALGYAFRRNLGNDLQTRTGIRLLACGVLTMALVMNAERNAGVDVSTLVLGNPGWFYFNALVGISAIVFLSQLIPRNAVSRLIAENTIVIFPLHLIAFGLLTAVAMFVFGFDKSFKDASLAWSLLYTAAAVAMCVACGAIVRRHSPWAIGFRNTAKS